MGESPSARTERELADLRANIDLDVRELRSRVREDIDPRNLARRQPLAVFGTAGSILALGAVRVARMMRERRLRRSDADLDEIIARLGGRVDRLKGKARKRLRESLRREIGEVDSAPHAREALWSAATAALTAVLTVIGRRFASRLVADEDLPEERA